MHPGTTVLVVDAGTAAIATGETPTIPAPEETGDAIPAGKDAALLVEALTVTAAEEVNTNAVRTDGGDAAPLLSTVVAGAIGEEASDGAVTTIAGPICIGCTVTSEVQNVGIQFPISRLTKPLRVRGTMAFPPVYICSSSITESRCRAV